MNYSSLPHYLAPTLVLVGTLVGSIFNPSIAPASVPPTPTFKMAQSSSIAGSWRLVNMTVGDSPMPMVPSSTAGLTADFTGDRVAGSGGCNRFKGGFQVADNQLQIGPLASTFKACAEPVMKQERQYLTALQGAQRYELTQDGLEIFYQTGQGSGVLRFVPQGVRALW